MIRTYDLSTQLDLTRGKQLFEEEEEEEEMKLLRIHFLTPIGISNILTVCLF